MQWRRVALALLLLAVVACGGSASDTTGEPFGPREFAVVEARTPDPLVVPTSLPDDFLVHNATIVGSFADTGNFLLFGEADRPDLADGKQIVVGNFASSAYGLFDCDVRDGAVGTCGEWTVAPSAHPGCESDCWAFLMGRNVTETELATAADSLSFDGVEPSLDPNSLPVGVTQLVEAPMSVYESVFAPGAQVVTNVRLADRPMAITAVDGGQPLVDLFRFFVAPDGGLAPLASWDGRASLGVVRVVGSTVVAVLGHGYDLAEIERVAESVEPEANGAWEQLRVDAANLPLAELMNPEGDDPIVAVVEGRFSGGQWAVAYTDLGEFGLEHTVASNGPDPDDFNQSSDGGIDVPPADQVTVLSGGGFRGGGFSGDVLDGFTPKGTRSVIVTVDGKDFDAALSEPSTLPGQPRLWAVFREEGDAGPSAPWLVIARDAMGTEIGRATGD